MEEKERKNSCPNSKALHKGFFYLMLGKENLLMEPSGGGLRNHTPGMS